MTRHIPVTILGGYLGAGKTTVINHLLAGDHGIRIAVLVNDFGAVNVDASLIAETADDSIALTNGCVCCSIADDLGEALDAQTARADPPDHIVIEASGVAEPHRIAAYAQGWPGVALNNVVTVADAETVRDRSADKYVGGVVTRQIATADLLVLNRVDLVSDIECGSVANWLETRSPDTPVVQSVQGRVGADRLLSRRSRSRTEEDRGSKPDHGLLSRIWTPVRPVLIGAMKAALESAPESVHRAKGHIRDSENDELCTVQMSGGRVDIDHAGYKSPEAAVVLIGTSAADLENLEMWLTEQCEAGSTSP